MDAKEAATVVAEDMDGAVKLWRIKLTKEIDRKKKFLQKSIFTLALHFWNSIKKLSIIFELFYFTCVHKVFLLLQFQVELQFIELTQLFVEFDFN
jgi:hypothetical protein